MNWHIGNRDKVKRTWLASGGRQLTGHFLCKDKDPEIHLESKAHFMCFGVTEASGALSENLLREIYSGIAKSMSNTIEKDENENHFLVS